MASWENLVFVFEIRKLSISTFQFYVYQIIISQYSKTYESLCIFLNVAGLFKYVMRINLLEYFS